MVQTNHRSFCAWLVLSWGRKPSKSDQLEFKLPQSTNMTTIIAWQHFAFFIRDFTAVYKWNSKWNVCGGLGFWVN